MKASDYIANFLSKHTEYAYGGQGSSVIHFIDSFKKNKGNLVSVKGYFSFSQLPKNAKTKITIPICKGIFINASHLLGCFFLLFRFIFFVDVFY